MNEYYIKNKVLPYLYISAGMGGKFAARAAAIGEAMDRQTRKKEFSNMKKKLGLTDSVSAYSGAGSEYYSRYMLVQYGGGTFKSIA